MECLDISGYLRRLKPLLDCPRPLRNSFLRQTRRMGEDFIQGKPDATGQDVVDYLGEPQELARGFLESLAPDVLERHRKRKRWAQRGCIAALVLVLAFVSVWCYILWHEGDVVYEMTETLIIYSEPTDEPEAMEGLP